jgi:hypothetical protein
VPEQSYEVFEPLLLDRATLFPVYAAHSEIRFYSWGEKQCCLKRGSTSATLLDGWLSEKSSSTGPDGQPAVATTRATKQRLLRLRPGDVLIFEEVLGPITGNPADVDPSRRHAVRLTKVTPSEDTLCRQPIVEVEWVAADALPFSFCLSAISAAPDCRYLENISVARGNVLLADHGKTQDPADLGQVPTLRTEAVCECAGRPGEVRTIAGEYRPHLAKAPLTYREPLPTERSTEGRWTPASEILGQEVRLALPEVKLISQPTRTWAPSYDLIESGPNDGTFVVEIDDDRIAHLRFSDGELGFAPAAGTAFQAIYRIGSGSVGNVGPEAISRLVRRATKMSGANLQIRNPLPARGGVDPEPTAEAKLFAPQAFRDPKQIQRAIIADDYAVIAARDPKIQRAAAALVWTGSWYEADVAVDPRGSEKVDAGHDLHVLAPRYVPLELRLEVCVQPHFQRAHVKSALLDVFSNRTLAGGRLGFFHPGNLTFGEGVFTSKIIAAAQAVTGVSSVVVSVFNRWAELPNHELDNSILNLRVNEVAQLDNDPNWPEHGKLEIEVCGGR